MSRPGLGLELLGKDAPEVLRDLLGSPRAVHFDLLSTLVPKTLGVAFELAPQHLISVGRLPFQPQAAGHNKGEVPSMALLNEPFGLGLLRLKLCVETVSVRLLVRRKLGPEPGGARMLELQHAVLVQRMVVDDARDLRRQHKGIGLTLGVVLRIRGGPPGRYAALPLRGSVGKRRGGH